MQSGQGSSGFDFGGRRKSMKLSTHCRHGHLYTEANTGWRMRQGKLHRACRECYELMDELRLARRHQRAGTKIWDTTKNCRGKARHRRTPENTAVSKTGEIRCRLCNRAASRARDKRITTLMCQVRGCKGKTERVVVTDTSIYICPRHRKNPTPALVRLGLVGRTAAA